MRSWKSRRSVAPTECEPHPSSIKPACDRTGSLDATSSSGLTNEASVMTQSPPGRSRDSVVSLGATSNVASTEPRLLASSAHEAPDDQSKRKRFSFLKFRHASDSQLSQTAKEHAASPPLPTRSPPSIITTAPTLDNIETAKKTASKLPRRHGAITGNQAGESLVAGEHSLASMRQRIAPRAMNGNLRSQRETTLSAAPPPYGDETSSALALPISRMSESSHSDGSSNDQRIFATTTTTHTVSTTTTFFRIPRRKRDKGHLFPLPPRVQSDLSPPADPTRTLDPRPSADSSGPSQDGHRLGDSDEHRTLLDGGPASPSPLSLETPLGSARSASRESLRFSSTLNARASHSEDGRNPLALNSPLKSPEHNSLPTPTLPPSTRTSISTIGRPSLGGLFQFSRLRQASEPAFPRGSKSSVPGTPASIDSRHPLLGPAREPPIVVPARQEGDTPAKYLARLEEVVNRSALVSLLTKTDDEFSKNVLRSYIRRFSFFEDPLDIAIRKLLMHVELPKETQQIDRTLQSFADRYHECNPGIFVSPDDAYFVAFSVLILHTDVFNKNNKHKMQKPDYVKNTKDQSGISPEVLEYLYDNIAYTPFIHVEEDMDVTSDNLVPPKSPRKRPPKASGAPALKKSSSGPLDPYALILEGKLELLRPAVSETLAMEDPFHYTGPSGSINITDTHYSFFRSGVVQILSARSRPEAFLNQATISNPAVAQVGVVDLKVSKVGLLWRKDPKKKKTRSPWQEWGAILTSSQLYLFRNATWVKTLMHQYDTHHKSGRPGTPVVYKPPLDQFKPDFLVPTDDVIALVDSQYKKHKNAFVLARRNVFQEILLADSENDLNEWLSRINYAATFRTAGVRMKAISNSSLDTSKNLGSRVGPFPSDQTNVDGHANGHPSPADSLATQVLVARRQIMEQRMKEADAKILISEKRREEQLRTARHLGVLAPIQPKTRDDVIAAAEKLATSIRWCRIEAWRLRCHRDILNMDIEEDTSLTSRRESALEITPKKEPGWQSKSPFSRFNSKSSGVGGNNSRLRPNTQPTGTKLFSMDELFRSPSKVKATSHKPKGSWEIPPLSFDLRRSNSLPRALKDPGQQMKDAIEVEKTSDKDVAPLENTESEKITADPSKSIDGDEHRFLAEAGILSAETPPSLPGEEVTPKGDPSKKGNDENVDIADKGSLPKARHGLQKKIQNAHIPSHHRSRRARDSTNLIESNDGGSTEEGERLTRNEEGFTVHGKKASVIRFGSEWQALSHDETVRPRKVVSTSYSDLDRDASILSTVGADPDDMRLSSTASSVSNAERSTRQRNSQTSSVELQSALTETPNGSLADTASK